MFPSHCYWSYQTEAFSCHFQMFFLATLFVHHLLINLIISVMLHCNNSIEITNTANVVFVFFTSVCAEEPVKKCWWHHWFLSFHRRQKVQDFQKSTFFSFYRLKVKSFNSCNILDSLQDSLCLPPELGATW